MPTLQTVARRLNALDDSAQTAVKALAVNEDALKVTTLQEACALDMDTVYCRQAVDSQELGRTRNSG